MIPAVPINGPLSGALVAPGDVLSPSQVSTITDCAYRWHAKHVLKMPEPPTSSQILGKAVHNALAANFDQKCDTKVDLPVTGVVALYREAWAALSEGTEFRDDEDADELGKIGEALVSKYMEEAAPRIEPAAVEMRVEGVIAGVKVVGYIDLLDVDGCVIEIKTAKARPSSLNPMHRFQVATYWHLIPLARGTGRIDTLVKTKSTQLIQQTFSISEQELRPNQTLYPEARKLVRGRVHLPNRHSLLCSRRHCAFWRHCEQNGRRGPGDMKPQRNTGYLAWIRTQPCLVCGSNRWIEAAHTGPHGLGQKSPDSSAVPLCARHHRTGDDSYHRLGPRKFEKMHSLDLASITRRLNLRPRVRIQNGEFVAHLEGCQYRLGKARNGIAPALRNLRAVCGEDRLAL